MNADWFLHAGFGCFIHWGLYAVPGGIWKGQETDYIGEWLQARFRIPNAEYSPIAKQFNPVNFNADNWIRRMRDAGMKYLIFTAKHHEGFAMYHSKVSPYNICDATPFGRDPLAELAEACRKYGVRLGIYYSQYLDWHEKDAGDPKDVGDNFGASWGNDWDFPDRSRKDFDRYYREKVVPQVRELMTGYGPIHVIWFDCPLDMPAKYSKDLCELVHSYQPDCLVNGRIGNGCGDYASLGDNEMPGSSMIRMSESPVTLNDTWGYKKNDHHWKTAETILHFLLGCAERRANLLLNIGPQPDGEFPEASVKILRQIAVWQKQNGRPILERNSGNPFPQTLPFAYVLLSGKVLHFYLKAEMPGKVTLSGVRGNILFADIPFVQNGENVVLDFSGIPVLRDIKVHFESVPEISQELIVQNGFLELSPKKGVLKTGKDSGGNISSAVHADGTLDFSGDHAAFGDTGNLIHWQNPSDSIAWTLFFPEAGTYRICCETRSAIHSHPWVGGRTVEIILNGESHLVQLKAEKEPEKTYYPSAVSVLGEFTVPAGKYTLSLRTVALTEKDAEFMNLVRLTVQQEKSR